MRKESIKFSPFSSIIRERLHNLKYLFSRHKGKSKGIKRVFVPLMKSLISHCIGQTILVLGA